ncbi:hypothetical protein DFO45_1843 [Azorhizobium sp. AG788]|uniref:DUF6683 family protein n=1 Tax=Azorhizobium sp. AG788 TaxID=2183897 RepID=UPI00105D2AA3|nr:DUF6683 family protein [Azorhizobium sp. AG788]TDT96648.1 hypothetical protein DFO45_1843 [Azorhizobium sp. AG788]
MRRFVRVAALAAPLIWGGPAGAQVVDGWGWSIIIPSITGTDVLGLHLRDLRRQDEERARRAAQGQAAAPRSQPAVDTAVLRYTPSKARRAANLAGMVEKTRASDPAGAADLQKLFAEGDIIASIDARLRPQGLRVDDLGDAFAVWWTTVWAAARGSNDTPPPRTVNAVRRQAAEALSGADGIRTATDAQKQELAEALLVQAVLIDGAVDQAKGNPAQMRQVSAAARKMAGGMGLDVGAMQLTEKGFVLAGGSR